MGAGADITPGFVLTMARYNTWQNLNIYETACGLTDAQRSEDRGAFFQSIAQTLNHIVWADQMWLHRLYGTERPAAPTLAAGLTQFQTWQGLTDYRRLLDERIEGWAASLSADDIDGELGWLSGATGKAMTTRRSIAIAHMFNHQTHHRGQVHAILTGFGLKPGPTDLPFAPFL